MPRKQAAAPAVPVVEAPPPAVSIPVDPDPSAWAEQLAELGGDADVRISVYSEPDKGQGGAGFLFTVSAADYPEPSDLLTYIRTHPDGGPGLYSLRLKKGTRFMGAPRVRIAGRRQDPPAPAIAVAPPAPAPGIGVDFLEKLVLALIARPQPAGGGFGDVIEAAKLLAPPARSPTPISDLKELLTLGELFTKKRGDDEGGAAAADGDDWLTATIKTFGPAIAAHVAATSPAPTPMQRAPQLAPPMPQAPAAQPAPGPRAPSAPAAAAPVAPQNPLAPLLGLLIRGAVSEGDPAAYASVALDLLGDYAPMLLGRPDAIDQLMAMAPPAVPHRAWFGELLEAAREMLAESSDEAPPAGGLTGAETGPDGPAHVGDESAAVP